MMRALQAAYRKTHLDNRTPLFRTHVVGFNTAMMMWLKAADGAPRTTNYHASKRNKRSEHSTQASNTVHACPACGHMYCNSQEHRPTEDRIFISAGMCTPPAPLPCGKGITAAGRRYCCQCMNRFEPPSPPRRAPSHATRDESRSPTSLMALTITTDTYEEDDVFDEYILDEMQRAGTRFDEGDLETIAQTNSSGKVSTVTANATVNSLTETTSDIADDSTAMVLTRNLDVSTPGASSLTAAMNTNNRTHEGINEPEHNGDECQTAANTGHNYRITTMARCSTGYDTTACWKLGDLTEARDMYIVHQTNCLTRRAAGLARQMFERFPHADCYANRTHASQPGTIDVRGNGTSQRYVVNLHAQYAPGRGHYTSKKDNRQTRTEYFRQCLHWLKCHIMQRHPAVKVSVGFPARIGCGLAGGNWNVYIGMIEYFTRTLQVEHHAKDTVTIYYLEWHDYLTVERTPARAASTSIRDTRKIYKF